MTLIRYPSKGLKRLFIAECLRGPATLATTMEVVLAMRPRNDDIEIELMLFMQDHGGETPVEQFLTINDWFENRV